MARIFRIFQRLRCTRKALMIMGYAAVVIFGQDAWSQELVHFPSFAEGADGSAVTLNGYLYRPDSARSTSAPAIVFLHGCGGMINKRGIINVREVDWAQRLVARGYVVLMVDSLTPRGLGEMCSTAGFKGSVYRDRPADAYGALEYLRSQSFVRADRIGVMGWSQGGGVVLMSLADNSRRRPPQLGDANFRVAVAFYPGSCSRERLGNRFESDVPLLTLLGAKDVWSPAAPCQELLDTARPGEVEVQIYPNAYHDFDWPNLPVHSVPKYKTSKGVIPIEGTDPEAREDALARVPQFLDLHLMDTPPLH